MTRDKKNYYLMNKTYNNFKIQNNVEIFKADKVNNVSDGCESSAESVLNEQHLSLGLDSNISETFANSSQNDVEYMSTEVSIEDRISDSPRLLVVMNVMTFNLVLLFLFQEKILLNVAQMKFIVIWNPH